MANEVKISAISETVYGITERRYRQLAQEGYVPKPVNGEVDFIVATKKYIAHLRAQIEGDGSISLTDERTRKTKAEAEIKEMELAHLKGTLISKEEVLKEFLARIQVLKSDLLALPKSLPPGKDRDRIKSAILRQLRTYSRPSGILAEGKKARSRSAVPDVEK